MTTPKTVAPLAQPEFYHRPPSIPLPVAHHVLSSGHHSDEAERAYANRILAGAENSLMLAMHVAAANEGIAETLTVSGGVSVQDAKIERVLEAIWAVRAAATEPVQTEAVLGQIESVTHEHVTPPPRSDHDHPPVPPDPIPITPPPPESEVGPE